MRLGISGFLARAFIVSPLTPLLLLASVIAGVIALTSMAREEEPQIDVPLVDIMVRADGLAAADAVELLTKPLEEIVKGIEGVEHTYSRTLDDQLIVSARFFVGTSPDTAILRVHEKLRANFDKIPLGIPEPLIVGRGTNDVAMLTLTLAPKPEAAGRWNDNALHNVASQVLSRLVAIKDVGQVYIVGGRPDQIRVEPDPERLAQYGVTLNQLVEKVRNANRSFIAGSVREEGGALTAVAGRTLQGVADIGSLLLITRDGRPVFVKDVADIVVGGRPDERVVWQMTPDGAGGLVSTPAVTIALAKRAGANAIEIAEAALARVREIERTELPADLTVTVNRDDGQTANEKVNELLFHMALATATIAMLISLAVGWREGIVTVVVVPTTILLTLFASWLLGYTINSVSLFALIFSIGILVDDAIVVVENISRHWAMNDGRSRVEAAVDGVAEVGNPTIIATLAVILALLPTLFVSGLMGPYMSSLPANASFAMLFSYFIAMVLTPWFVVTLRLATREEEGAADRGNVEKTAFDAFVERTFLSIAGAVTRTRPIAWTFLIVVGLVTVSSLVPVATWDVAVKLLPFANKSELQVVVDLPTGATIEDTRRALDAIARRMAGLPELRNIQAHVGTAAPFNFTGMVRQYYLRDRPEQGDLQVNLVPKSERERTSHDIALEIRRLLAGPPVPTGSVVKVVEVPPGAPVAATLVAEVYGPDAEARRTGARLIESAFRDVDYLVDVDDSFHDPGKRIRFAIDRENLEFHGVDESAVYETLLGLMGGITVGYSHRGEGRTPIEIAIRLPNNALHLSERILSTPVPGARGTVELGDLVEVIREPASRSIYRRDGRYAEMITAELAGRFEAPIYGMMEVGERLQATDWGTAGFEGPPEIRVHGQPDGDEMLTLLWDGEWEITYVTFRDMGRAFAVALLSIYLLVVAKFGSFKLPLLILIPIPLTFMGTVFGHFAFSAPFTSTSMVGLIALAGIIVRNSVLLVDFTQHLRDERVPVREAALRAAAIRFKPIALTALAAMISSAFILTDPIFQGLAITMLFGLLSATPLTVLVIPAIYVVARA